MDIEIDKHYQFLLKYFPGDIIFLRFKHLFTQLVDIVKALGISDNVDINEDLLMLSVLDYFADIARLKQFQNINNTNEQKTYSYGIYWLLRRAPIQIITTIDEEYIYINEKVAVAMIFPKMLIELGVDIVEDSARIKKFLREYLELLYYNFKYRLYSPQSLELMVEAFFCGCICFYEDKCHDTN